MNTHTLGLICDELRAEIQGRRLGRVFQLGRTAIAVDFRLQDSRYLYVDFGPADPSVYLLKRRLKDLERISGSPLPFTLSIKKYLSGAEVTSIHTLPGERVLKLAFTREDEFGSLERPGLTLQLTGRSANLFLTDASGIIRDRGRDTLGSGQQIGETYSPPDRTVPAVERETAADAAALESPSRPSEALDSFYAARQATERFESLSRAAFAKIKAEIRKREKLVHNLQNDLKAHGDPEEWKRIGDLLLSNVATARREGSSIFVTDYFSESLPEVEVEADEERSITEVAEEYFRRYRKARNAESEISARLEVLKAEVGSLQRRNEEIEKAVRDGDLAFLEDLLGKREPAPKGGSKKEPETGGVARRFISSDGFEVLVGKRAKDNDVLTFKIAKSLDTWMHAADYPGSHVVIRNPNRTEIPQRTLHEAAQLAAFYSQGKSQVKAAVHYTQKKFVNKPKGAAPGLVSLASFKTLLVEPNVPDGLRIS